MSPNPRQGGAADVFLKGWKPGSLMPRSDARDGGLVFVIAVLCFFACIAAVAALAADRAATGWTSQLKDSATVLVRPTGGETADAAAARAAEALADVAGVKEARALERDQAAALLEPWLGKGVLADDLPIPRLVTLDLDPNRPPSAAILQNALKARDVDATVDDHSLWIRDIVRAGAWARAAAIAVFALTALAAAAVIAFAARAVLASRREIVGVLHVAGAKDGFIAGLLARRFAAMAFVAGVGGALLAAGLGAAARLAGGGMGLTPVLPVAWLDLAALLPCPFLAAAVAALAARSAAMRLLKESP
ncbi:MAG: FtsX-like permease family protein [Caulobacteraceae bacterium]